MARSRSTRAEPESLATAQTAPSRPSNPSRSKKLPFSGSPRDLAQRRRIEGIRGSARAAVQRVPFGGNDVVNPVMVDLPLLATRFLIHADSNRFGQHLNRLFAEQSAGVVRYIQLRRKIYILESIHGHPGIVHDQRFHGVFHLVAGALRGLREEARLAENELVWDQAH